jgi:hypothetical protein
MLTPKGIFFAPHIRFNELNLKDAQALADALCARAERWFFGPAEDIAASSPFASGIVAVCFMDAAAEFEGTTMTQWLREAVPSTAQVDPRRSKKSIADSFEEDVRHGLVHHARLSRGAEFSLDLDQAVALVGSVLVVNPRELLAAIRARWQHFIDRVRLDSHTHQSTADRIARIFRADFEADAAWTPARSRRSA